MTTTHLIPAGEVRAGPQPKIHPSLLRPRTLLLGGIAVVGVGLALNWGWLTAIGAAPILLALLPCAAMCALGLCMRGGASSDSCATRSATDAKPSRQDAPHQ